MPSNEGDGLSRWRDRIGCAAQALFQRRPDARSADRGTAHRRAWPPHHPGVKAQGSRRGATSRTRWCALSRSRRAWRRFHGGCKPSPPRPVSPRRSDRQKIGCALEPDHLTLSLTSRNQHLIAHGDGNPRPLCHVSDRVDVVGAKQHHSPATPDGVAADFEHPPLQKSPLARS